MKGGPFNPALRLSGILSQHHNNKGCPISRVFCEKWEPRTPAAQAFAIDRHHAAPWKSGASAPRKAPEIKQGFSPSVATKLALKGRGVSRAKQKKGTRLQPPTKQLSTFPAP
jgi:hypothetical protein